MDAAEMQDRTPVRATDATRHELRAVIDSLQEGTPFLPDALLAGRPDLLPAFYEASDLHVPVGGGYHVGIVHTRYLKRLPAARTLAAAWAELHGRAIVEDGNWTAHRLGLVRWEPMEGIGYFWDGAESRLRMRTINIIFRPAPAWLRDQSAAGRMARAVAALPERSAVETLAKHLVARPEAGRVLETAIAHARAAAAAIAAADDGIAAANGVVVTVDPAEDPERVATVGAQALEAWRARADKRP